MSVDLSKPSAPKTKKGSGTCCRNGPKTAAHKRFPTPCPPYDALAGILVFSSGVAGVLRRRLSFGAGRKSGSKRCINVSRVPEEIPIQADRSTLAVAAELADSVTRTEAVQQTTSASANSSVSPGAGVPPAVFRCRRRRHHNAREIDMLDRTGRIHVDRKRTAPAGLCGGGGSPGVCDDDARESAVWGRRTIPCSIRVRGREFHLHPLPSGASCISLSVPWRAAPRRRPAGLHRLSDRAATCCPGSATSVLAHPRGFGQGLWRLRRSGTGLELSYDPRLEPLTLTAGGAAPVDQASLAMLAADPGPNVAVLVRSARDAVCLALLAGLPPLP